MKTKKILLIITLIIISFVCFTDNTNVKADSNDNWVYETTIDGTMTINYTVAGRFGEYSQTAIDENGNHWRADGLRLSNTTSFDVPVKIAVKRNTAGKATYSMTVKTDSRWEMMNLCGASGASKDQWSWIIVNGNAYFDFTATGEHDLTGLEACDKTIDLTSKGCIFKVDKIYDNNPDWIIDEENWTTQKVNSITLKFTYPKIYTVSYYVRNENTDGSWGNYWLWYTEYHKYGDTYSTTGYKDDVEYQEVSASGTVDDDKTIYLDAYKKWYTIKYYVKNENVDGSWGDYWFWFETSYRYGSTYHTDGYGNDESGADNDIYSNFCIRGTVTGNKDWYIDAYRRRYALDLNMVYGDKKLCTNEEISPFFSFDVYINGKLTDENIADYWTELPYGTTYEFRNFRMKPGYVFGDNGSLSGTIGAKNNEAVAYVYDDYALAYYGGNGATGGQGNANGGNDYYVSYNIRYNYLNENGNASAMNNLFTKNNYAFVNYKTENGNYRKAGENIDTSDNNNARAVIRSAYNNNLVFNVAGDNNVDGTNIQLWWDDISNYSNYWSFLPSGDGYYYIVNNTNGKFLDLAYGNTSDLANVQLHHLNWSEAQQWKLIPAGDGYYYIASRCNENYRLDTEGGSQSSNAGQNVCVYHGQKWKIDFLNREDYFQVQWTPATRLIEYYGNGDNDNFSYFKSLQATDDNIADTNRFKRVGYTFTGYNTSADSLGKSYKENDVIDKTDCQGITLIRNHTDYNIAVKQNNSTLYAQQADYEMTQWWSFIKADNAQAYYIMNMSTGQALYSSSGEVKTAALDKSNSAFMWDLELVDVHEYKISVHNKNEYLTMRSDNSIYVDSKYSDTESSYDYQVWNIDGISSALYAEWEANIYNLTFDANGGNLKFPGDNINNPNGNKSNTVQVKYDSDWYCSMNNDIPEKEGYTFGGWYRKDINEDISEQIYDAFGKIVLDNTSCYTYKNGKASWCNEGDVTLYAYWIANKYTIVFDANKPANSSSLITGNMPNIICMYDTPVNIPANSYQIKGWDFVGFNTKADGSGDNIIPGSTVINLTSVNNGVVTLYAQWDAHIEWNASLSKINNDSIDAFDLTNDDKAVNWEHGLGYGKIMHNTLTYTEFGDMQGFLDVEINDVVPTKIKYEFSDTRINSIQLSNDEHTDIGIENGKAVYLHNVSSATSSGYLHKISFNIPDYEAEFDVNKEKEYSAYVDISVSYNVRNTGNEITETRRVYYNLEELDMSKVHSRIRRQPGQANN